ncbi:MAG: SRPBCC domain-containing protein [Bacillati bacterium ANGP1]|uniref:SRPBCC domain-containing protein n=1 Tax=Candidatus Segetimicrobium genomatis TaxID=2569760 RepID=A0A537KDP6_9BACT|nr:MAG: SRPBCC domain-containing protein [Terrabacteria group bacterium ANGP1]
MVMSTSEQTVTTLEVTREEDIAAPIDVVFETLLEQIGPRNEGGPGSPLPMKLEAWPGGRWYRDLGNSTGHLWGHVQVIKPPTLLEISGPLFMSYPAISHVQYRLTAEGARTRLTFAHRAIGLITPEHREGVVKGWTAILTRIREAAERR